MADRKKNSGRSSGSKSKSRTKPQSRSGSAESGRRENGRSRSDVNSRIRDEIAAVIIIAVGVFLAVAFQTSAAGTLGNALSDFFKGCFGFAAYILPYYFIIYGIMLFAKQTIHVGVKSAVLLMIIFIVISLMNAGRFIDPYAVKLSFGSVYAHYLSGIQLESGGVFGMMAGGGIVRFIGLPGLYILSVVVLFICLMLLLNTPVSRFLEEARCRRERRAAAHEEKLREKERIKAERLKQMEMELTLGSFDTGKNPAKENVTKGQRQILDYISSESFDPNDESNEGRLNTSPDESDEEEVLDFTLGENPPPKKKRGRKKKTPEISDDTAQVPVLPEEITEHRGPVIVGGCEPKKPEVKLTRAEAAGSMLKQDDFNVTVSSAEDYKFPPVELLSTKKADSSGMDNEKELREKAMKLEDTLHSFNIDAQVTNVTQGPAVTRYEVHPNSGVKVKGIKNLADDIALNMEAKSIRIEAPIPGKPAVGIEIENDRVNMVTVREIIDSAAFRKAESKISFAVGKDIAGNAIVGDLKSMPHLLIAGSTGSGKSVCINSIITSILYKARPDEVKLVLIDPKVVELANYNGIPHLLIPVVTEPAKAAAALNWAVAEMDERYRKFASEKARALSSYNRIVRERGEEDLVMPQVVIIIDELADLMMAAPSQVEESICRLAQKARAAGMHLIVATQRPSVDVITGVIKANIPSRIAFAVSSQFDSRTILDMQGAEKLVGKGDMLYHPLGSGKPVRVQGTFISDEEVQNVIDFVKEQVDDAEYSENVMDTIERANVAPAEKHDRDLEDELLQDAIELVVDAQQASVSMLQRRFRIGYNRAARIIDMMEDRQIIGPSDGSRPRQVLISEDELADMKEETEDIEE